MFSGTGGTAGQNEWAQRIKQQVSDEFDRVARAFRSVAGRQSGIDREETGIILVILEDKRSDVMSRNDAGYFIHDWQEISDQVRQMIGKDPRYEAIKASRAARR